VSFDRAEPTDNLVTWIYDTDSYVPTAKLVDGKRYGIVSDYIGRPVQAYDEHGTPVWQADYDIYGNLRNLRGDNQFVPFRQLGQYEDEETGLYYNRFRYYEPSTGGYISQDPIGLAGENPTLYGYVFDSNTEIDPFGLECGRKVKPLKEGDKVYRVYGGDSKAGGASWARVSPNKYKNYRNSAGLPSGKESEVTNTGRFVIEGIIKDPSKVVKSRKAIPLDGNKGGIDEYIIPNWENNGAIEIIRVSGVNPEF